jgi:hypothetical protein
VIVIFVSNWYNALAIYTEQQSMKMQRQQTFSIFFLYQFAEGGMSQRCAVVRANQNGSKWCFGISITEFDIILD